MRRIVGIIGGAVEVVIGLQIGAQKRRIGFANDNRAGCFQTLHGHRIRLGHHASKGGIADIASQADNLKSILNGHRNPVQRPVNRAARAFFIGQLCFCEGLVETCVDDSVNVKVVLFNALDKKCRYVCRVQFAAADFLPKLRGAQFQN